MAVFLLLFANFSLLPTKAEPNTALGTAYSSEKFTGPNGEDCTRETEKYSDGTIKSSKETCKSTTTTNQPNTALGTAYSSEKFTGPNGEDCTRETEKYSDGTIKSSKETCKSTTTTSTSGQPIPTSDPITSSPTSQNGLFEQVSTILPDYFKQNATEVSSLITKFSALEPSKKEAAGAMILALTSAVIEAFGSDDPKFVEIVSQISTSVSKGKKPVCQFGAWNTLSCDFGEDIIPEEKPEPTNQKCVWDVNNFVPTNAVIDPAKFPNCDASKLTDDNINGSPCGKSMDGCLSPWIAETPPKMPDGVDLNAKAVKVFHCKCGNDDKQNKKCYLDLNSLTTENSNEPICPTLADGTVNMNDCSSQGEGWACKKQQPEPWTFGDLQKGSHKLFRCDCKETQTVNPPPCIGCPPVLKCQADETPVYGDPVEISCLGKTENCKVVTKCEPKDPVVCTTEYKQCPDGSPMPRDPKTCKWKEDKCKRPVSKCTCPEPEKCTANEESVEGEVTFDCNGKDKVCKINLCEPKDKPARCQCYPLKECKNSQEKTEVRVKFLCDGKPQFCRKNICENKPILSKCTCPEPEKCKANEESVDGEVTFDCNGKDKICKVNLCEPKDKPARCKCSPLKECKDGQETTEVKVKFLCDGKPQFCRKNICKNKPITTLCPCPIYSLVPGFCRGGTILSEKYTKTCSDGSSNSNCTRPICKMGTQPCPCPIIDPVPGFCPNGTISSEKYTKTCSTGNSNPNCTRPVCKPTTQPCPCPDPKPCKAGESLERDGVEDFFCSVTNKTQKCPTFKCVPKPITTLCPCPTPIPTSCLPGSTPGLEKYIQNCGASGKPNPNCLRSVCKPTNQPCKCPPDKQCKPEQEKIYTSRTISCQGGTTVCKVVTECKDKPITTLCPCPNLPMIICTPPALLELEKYTKTCSSGNPNPSCLKPVCKQKPNQPCPCPPDKQCKPEQERVYTSQNIPCNGSTKVCKVVTECKDKPITSLCPCLKPSTIQCKAGYIQKINPYIQTCATGKSNPNCKEAVCEPKPITQPCPCDPKPTCNSNQILQPAGTKQTTCATGTPSTCPVFKCVPKPITQPCPCDPKPTCNSNQILQPAGTKQTTCATGTPSTCPVFKCVPKPIPTVPCICPTYKLCPQGARQVIDNYNLPCGPGGKIQIQCVKVRCIM